MENASKALIIAGAILLSIAIIGVGMFVYQSVSETITGAADMSEQEIQAYNGTFTTYGGEKVRGSQVKALCDKINSHNLSAVDASELIIIENGTDQATDPNPAQTDEDVEAASTSFINSVKSGILSGKTYKVTFGYDKGTGLITTVGISDPLT